MEYDFASLSPRQHVISSISQKQLPTLKRPIDKGLRRI